MVAAAFALAPAAAGAKPQIPPAGHTQVIVGQDAATVRDYAAEMGPGYEPAGAMDYVFLESAPAQFAARLKKLDAEFGQWPDGAVQLGVTLGRSPFWSTLQGNPGSPGGVEVVRGAYDAQIDQLATWMKASADRTFHLRVGYEFDLLGGQWGPPGLFQDAYRHVVDRLRADGVTNALYVWHSSGAMFKSTDYSAMVGLAGTFDKTPGGQADPLLEAIAVALRTGGQAAGNGGDLVPIREFYPGRDYVDLFGISYWDDSFGAGRSSERARKIYRTRTQEILDEAKRLGLPLSLAESTPAYIGFNHGADSVAWLRDWFDLIERNDIRSASLIVPDWPALPGGFWGQPYWNGFWPDARVAHYDDTRRLWRAKLAEDRYGGHTTCVARRRTVTVRLPTYRSWSVRLVRARTWGGPTITRRGAVRAIRVKLRGTTAATVTVRLQVRLQNRRTGATRISRLTRRVATCARHERRLG